MDLRQTAVTALVIGTLAASTVACSGSDPAGGLSPSASAGASAAQPSKEVAVAQLRQFLDTWRADGLAAASKKFLVPEEQYGQSGAPLTLTAGKVAAVRNGPVGLGGTLVLDVDLELTFSGSSGDWTNGINERFVTFTPRSGAVPYVMTFATSH